MANIKSAKKRVLTNEKRRVRNISRKSEMKTVIKKVTEALTANDFVAAKSVLREAESKIARASHKGIIKKNTASRKISKIAQKIAAIEKKQAHA